MSLTGTAYLIISLASIVGLVLLAPRLTRPARWLLAALLLAELALAAATIITWPVEYRFLSWFVNISHEERNGGATLAATQLAVLGTLALVHAARLLRQRERSAAYWALFGLLFVGMGIDEFFQLHEPFRAWEYVYTALGILFLVATVAAFRSWWPRQKLVPGLIVAGLGLMAAGGLVVEHFVLAKGCYGLVEDCFGFQVYEEFLEFSGATLIFVAFVEHTYRGSHAPVDGRRLARLAVAAALGWALVFSLDHYVRPRLEARWLAAPVELEYLDGQIELLGYRIPNKPLTAKSGGLPVTLYWRASRQLEHEYGISMHLVQFPEVAAVTQNDIPIETPPASVWLPGQIVRQVIVIPIPPDMEAPRDYWLTLTLWQQPWYDHNYLPATHSDRELLLPQTPVLQTLTLHPAP